MPAVREVAAELVESHTIVVTQATGPSMCQRLEVPSASDEARPSSARWIPAAIEGVRAASPGRQWPAARRWTNCHAPRNRHGHQPRHGAASHHLRVPHQHPNATAVGRRRAVAVGRHPATGSFADAPRPNTSADDLDGIALVRPAASACRRTPDGVRGGGAVLRMPPSRVAFQSHTLESSDVLATWAVHHLNAGAELACRQEIRTPAARPSDVESLDGADAPRRGPTRTQVLPQRKAAMTPTDAPRPGRIGGLVPATRLNSGAPATGSRQRHRPPLAQPVAASSVSASVLRFAWKHGVDDSTVGLDVATRDTASCSGGSPAMSLEVEPCGPELICYVGR